MNRCRWLPAGALVALVVALTGCGRHKSCCAPEPPPRTANVPCCPSPGGIPPQSLPPQPLPSGPASPF